MSFFLIDDTASHTKFSITDMMTLLSSSISSLIKALNPSIFVHLCSVRHRLSSSFMLSHGRYMFDEPIIIVFDIFFIILVINLIILSECQHMHLFSYSFIFMYYTYYIIHYYLHITIYLFLYTFLDIYYFNIFIQVSDCITLQ